MQKWQLTRFLSFHMTNTNCEAVTCPRYGISEWWRTWPANTFCLLLYHTHAATAIFMVALCNRADHYIFALWFLSFSSSFFFFSPNLSHRRLDVCHTSTRGVALVQVWNLLHAARWKHKMQKSRQKSPSGHHRTTLSGYIFASKAHIDNRKKITKQQYVLHMFSQYGELRPTSGWH